MILKIQNQAFNNIKNVIFDLGGVIVPIDYQLPVDRFKKLGCYAIESIYSQHNQIDIFDKLDKGLISTFDFRKYMITHYCDKTITFDQFDEAWNSIILDIDKGIFIFLERLKTYFDLYLLSNTNEIHINYLFSILKNQYQIDSFDNYFVKVYLSCRIGMRKPEITIFNHVLKDAGINPSETLFIDDTITNILSAKSVGLQTYLMPQNANLSELIRWE